MMRLQLPIVCIIIVALQPTTTAADCVYAKYRHAYESYDGSLPIQGSNQFCYDCGYASECPNFQPGSEFCARQVKVYIDSFNCGDDSFRNSDAGDVYRCACSPADMAVISNTPDDSILPGYSCSTCESGVCTGNEPLEPARCDSRECTLVDQLGKGCGNDEFNCTEAHGTDAFPVYLGSGRVRSRSITLFSLPTPEGIEFGYTLEYDSHARNPFAIKRTINAITDTVPTIHHVDEVTHSAGMQWRDSFGDRLIGNQLGLSVFGQTSAAIAWTSMRGTVTFTLQNGVWRSAGGKFELAQRTEDTYGKWIIKSTDDSVPRQIWTFEKLNYKTIDNQTETIGRLRRRTLTTQATDVVGFYGYNVTWATDGTILSAVDTLGREIAFQYEDKPFGCTTQCKTRALSGIQYRPASSVAYSSVAVLEQNLGGLLLDRLENTGMSSTYKRFLYWTPPSTCKNCSALLSDVIVPGARMTTSIGNQAPVHPDEVVLEHHEFEVPTGTTAFQRPRAIESSGPGGHFAYTWDDANYTGVQYDLQQPAAACPSGCQAGEACFEGTCYVAQTFEWGFLRQPVRNHPFGASSSVGSAHPESLEMSYGPNGSPQRSTDTAGLRTTNGWDTNGRLRCVVRGDGEDDQAFEDPNNPNGSDCEGPSTAQIIKVDYASNTVTKTTPSLLGTSPVTEVQLVNQPLTACGSTGSGTCTTTTTTGATRNIDGATITLVKTTSRIYDAFGRLVVENGPLPDATALDRTTISYYAFDSLLPLNFGHVQSMTRYVGNASSNTAVTTTYAEYDRFGIPHKVTGPNGDFVTYTDSNQRLTWTITHKTATGQPIGTSEIKLNSDGTLRSSKDADGVCLTYDYEDATGVFIGAPTKIRRSNFNCGTLPIDLDSDEVEVRTYVNGDARRLASVERRNDGVSEFTYSGFTYDRDRRPKTANTLDSVMPFTFEYTDVVLFGTAAPGAPNAGSWRTETVSDEFARPSSLIRFINTNHKQTYSFAYGNPFTPRPTQVVRGFDGTSTSITYFVYDDFGRLVEATVPEAGTPGTARPSRYEYDIGDRTIKKRVGINSTAVRTSEYTYDSLGRLTFVDNDTEHNPHPFNCNGQPDGTPIQDEEYRYDSCTSDAPAGFSCTNAVGKLTISRAILQCSSNQVVKRGRWYDYDTAGRVYRVAYSTVTGSTIGAPAISTFTYTGANRVLSATNPLNSSYGTGYEYDFESDHGRPSRITTTSAQPSAVLESIQSRAFGPPAFLATPVKQLVGGGFRTLTLSTTYRADDSVSLLNWSLVGSGASTIALVKQEMTYGPAGLLSLRRDLADNLSSRYYEQDALLRMTCEARGSGTVVPSGSDCLTSSSRLAGFYSYGDGQDVASPPDVRLTSFIKAAGTPGASYTSPSTEGYTYTNGSGQTQQINRTGSSLVLGYDALGRRSFEYVSTSMTLSRRDYVYLPNGQLGNISGYDSGGQAYSIAIRYDEGGRPLTISTGSTLYELFWDEADRLVAARVSGAQTHAWHYHYLGARLIAVTRVIGTQIKRFWALTDERGLIYRMLDEQGATYWQARWDATGWRQIIGTPQANMWVPFALPGQIVLEGTEAFTNGSATTVRPPIALNRWRAYDPLLGQFLQPDSADQVGRLVPEGYAYGRANPVGFVDESGLTTEGIDAGLAMTLRYTLAIHDTCASSRERLINAVAHAYNDISKCVLGLCGEYPGGEVFRRRWMSNLARTSIYCPIRGQERAGHFIFGAAGFAYDIENGQRTGAFTDPSTDDPTMNIAPFKLENPACLAQTVAHESLHWTNYNNDHLILVTGTNSLEQNQFGSINISSYLNLFPEINPFVNFEEYSVWRTAGRREFGSRFKGCVSCEN